MKENLEIILTILKVIIGILVVGAVLAIVLGGLSLGVQMLWQVVPFGLTGVILGLSILGITYYFTQIFFPA